MKVEKTKQSDGFQWLSIPDYGRRVGVSAQRVWVMVRAKRFGDLQRFIDGHFRIRSDAKYPEPLKAGRAKLAPISCDNEGGEK